jgi:hypothetical protein
MRFSISALMLVILCLVCAVIIGKISKIISVDVLDGADVPYDDSTFLSRGLKNQAAGDHRQLPPGRIPGGTEDNLIWFLQVYLNSLCCNMLKKSRSVLIYKMKLDFRHPYQRVSRSDQGFRSQRVLQFYCGYDQAPCRASIR